MVELKFIVHRVRKFRFVKLFLYLTLHMTLVITRKGCILTNHPDLNFFQRGRRCKACGEEFITAEIEYEFLMELSNLRIALKDIKENAEIYNKQTVDGQKTLQKLQKSLSLLQALK